MKGSPMSHLAKLRAAHARKAEVERRAQAREEERRRQRLLLEDEYASMRRVDDDFSVFDTSSALGLIDSAPSSLGSIELDFDGDGGLFSGGGASDEW